jgi:hypothetical protein
MSILFSSWSCQSACPLPPLYGSAASIAFYRLLPHAPYVSVTQGLVFRGGVADREVHTVLRRRSTARELQLVSQGVKGAPEVLQYVGGNGCDLQGRFIDTAQVVDALAGLRVFLARDGVGVARVEGLDRQREVLDMLLGPCDFRVDAIDWPEHVGQSRRPPDHLESERSMLTDPTAAARRCCRRRRSSGLRR